MKKKKLSLDAIQVKSFVTSLKNGGKGTIKGGSGSPTQPNLCTDLGCTDYNCTAETCGGSGTGSEPQTGCDESGICTALTACCD